MWSATLGRSGSIAAGLHEGQRAVISLPLLPPLLPSPPPAPPSPADLTDHPNRDVGHGAKLFNWTEDRVWRKTSALKTDHWRDVCLCWRDFVLFTHFIKSNLVTCSTRFRILHNLVVCRRLRSQWTDISSGTFNEVLKKGGMLYWTTIYIRKTR